MPTICPQLSTLCSMPLIDPEIQRYLEHNSEPETELLHQLRRETYLQVLLPQMITDPVQGQLISMLSRLIAPKRILEVGTFTGYSCLRMAEGLAAEGEIVSIEVEPQRESRIRKYLELAGIADLTTLLIGDAMQIIPKLEGPFDLVFLDADKAHYPEYYEMIFPMLSDNGWILADNVLWQGKVLGEGKNKETRGLKKFNEIVRNDSRVEVLMLGLRDGLSLIRKKRSEEISD